jgi:hypothetical protein
MEPVTITGRVTRALDDQNLTSIPVLTVGPVETVNTVTVA